MAIDRRKYLYRIKRLEIKSWLKYLMIEGKSVVDYVLGELMTGTEITIGNTVKKKFYKFDVKGNSVQDGTPSPTNEVPIYSAGDNGAISEKIVNKNWFDKNDFAYIDGKRLDDNGNVVNDVESSYSTTLYRILPNSTYEIQGTQSITGKTTRIYYYDKNKTFLSRSSSYATDSYSFTTPSNCYYIGLQLRNSTYIDVDIIQIELGSTATTYVAHQEQTYTIPVQQPMRSIGTVRDEFIKVNGEWKERHKYRKYIFTGTEDWQKSTKTQEGFVRFYFSQQFLTIGEFENYQKSNILSSITNSQYSDITDINEGIDVVSSGINLKLKTDNNILTVADLKTYLNTLYNNGTPAYVIYRTNILVDLPCTAEQIAILENLPKSYNEQTNIYSIDTTPAYIEAQAYVKKEEE